MKKHYQLKLLNGVIDIVRTDLKEIDPPNVAQGTMNVVKFLNYKF